MNADQPHARIAYQGGPMAQAKNFALKGLLVLAGGVTLVSAFVVSLVFVAVGMAVVLTLGGYLWWKTRDVRRQVRAHRERQPQYGGNVIEGEVLSREEVRR